jgi:hypothetical protein
LMIPIMDEEQLFIFEEKLLEKSYKSCVVSENMYNIFNFHELFFY